jgi:hypothetical protein
MLISTGVAATLGLNTAVGAEKATDQAVSTADDKADSGAPTGDTLFGLYNVLSTQLGKILGVLNPGLEMLKNAGVPKPIIDSFLIPIVTVVKFIGIVSFLRGYDL